MPKTEAERRAVDEHIVADMRLEGIEPHPVGTALMERIIKGEIDAEEAIRLLQQHFKEQQNDLAETQQNLTPKENKDVLPEAQKQLFNAKPIAALQGTYHGKFVHIDEDHIYQELGHDNVVKHPKAAFVQNPLPALGKFGTVKYENGQAQLIAKSNRKDLDISR